MENKPSKNKYLIFFIFVFLALAFLAFEIAKVGDNASVDYPSDDDTSKKVESFKECVEAGNFIMESYPRKCQSGEETFVENIGNVLEKEDLIRLDNPRPNQLIESPLVIQGEARGTWFFEASFPVVLTNWDGLIIAEGIATAQGDWMTEDFVPFEATLTFEKPEYKNNGTLILQKDNPSGMPEHDDALEIPILFK